MTKMPKQRGLWGKLCNETWINPYCISTKNLNRLIKKASVHSTGVLLDIGCGNKPYYRIFEQRIAQYVGIEMPFTPSKSTVVDAFGTGLMLPVKTGSVDTVIGTGVLEHVPEPSMLLGEAYRVLKKGGCLIMTIPQTWGIHEAPHDYYRYTEYGIKYLAEKSGFEIITIEKDCGLWATTMQRQALFIYYGFGMGQSKKKLAYIPKVIFTPVHMAWQIFGYYFDILNKRKGDPLNYLLVARKPQQV